METPCGMDRGVVPLAPVALQLTTVDQLSPPTTDNIEVRICDEHGNGDNDTRIQLVELYVK